MARPAALNRRNLARALLATGLAVVTGHALVIEWLSRQAASPALVKMPEAVYATLLAPAAPIALPGAPTPPAGPSAASPRVMPAADGVMAATAPVTAEARPAAVPALPAASAAATAAAVSAPATASPASSISPPQAETPPAARTDPAPATAEATPAPSPTPVASPAAPAPTRDTWPPDTRLSYRLEGRFRGGPLYGSARVHWQRQGARYQAQVEIDLTPFGQRVMTSQGEVTRQGLVPRVYEERTHSRRRGLRLDDAQVVLADGRSLPRPADVQDAASQFVELGHRFATGQQALALGMTVPLWLARPGGVDRWIYDVVAQDLLQTPRLGEVMAWRLKPRPTAQRRDGASAEIWFAPTLQYLPVRIRLALGEEGEIDLTVDAIEQR